MLIATVAYPASAGTKFDHGYYMTRHMPMVERLWGPMGLTEWSVLRGTVAPDGSAPQHEVFAQLHFESADAFKAATTAPAGSEIFGDIPNYTDIKPVIEFFEKA